MLAVAGLILAHCFLGALLAAVWANIPGLRDFLLTIGGAIVGADLLGISYYFGKRSGDGG